MKLNLFLSLHLEIISLLLRRSFVKKQFISHIFNGCFKDIYVGISSNQVSFEHSAFVFKFTDFLFEVFDRFDLLSRSISQKFILLFQILILKIIIIKQQWITWEISLRPLRKLPIKVFYFEQKTFVLILVKDWFLLGIL